MRSLSMFVLALLVACGFSAHAQTSVWVESKNIVHDGKTTPQVNFYASSPLGKKTGLFAWSLVRGKYAEGIVGATFAPNPNLEFGLGGGIENDNDPWRMQGTMFAAHRRLSYLAIVETGGSGPWYSGEVKMSGLLGRLPVSTGIRAERFIGIGPRFETKVGRAAIWIVPLTIKVEKGEGHRSVASLRLIF